MNDSWGIVDQLSRSDWKGWCPATPATISILRRISRWRRDATRRGMARHRAFHFPRKIYDVNQMHKSHRPAQIRRLSEASRIFSILNSAAGTIWLAANDSKSMSALAEFVHYSKHGGELLLGYQSVWSASMEYISIVQSKSGSLQNHSTPLCVNVARLPQTLLFFFSVLSTAFAMYEYMRPNCQVKSPRRKGCGTFHVFITSTSTFTSQLSLWYLSASLLFGKYLTLCIRLNRVSRYLSLQRIH